jgi:hypothetical protein
MYLSPYPLQRIEEVGAWAGSVARTEQCRSSNGFVGFLSATTFVDTAQAAITTLNLLENCLVAPECLQLEVNQPTLLAALLGNPLVGFPACAIAALDPLAVGHYVGESDIASHPSRAERSFARTNWQRLQALR